MNAKAEEAIRLLKTKADRGELIPTGGLGDLLSPFRNSPDLEEQFFADFRDYINSPGRSNAVALWEKLRSTAGHTHEITEDPQRWEGATRQLLQMLLVPFTDDTFSTKHISALFKAIKEEVEG
jgi:hypothetical protein